MATIVKTEVSAKPAVIVLAWHNALATAVAHFVRTEQTLAEKCKALVTSTYGDVPPTFAQYKADLKAFSAIAEKGKVSEQNLHKAYRAAVKELFGEMLKAQTGVELPVSMEADAVMKRAERKAKEEKIAAAMTLAEAVAQQTPAGAPKGKTQERQPSEAEQTDSIVARIGVYECMYACIRLLEVEKATQANAVHLRKMVDAARKAQDAADKAKREAAITPQAILA